MGPLIARTGGGDSGETANSGDEIAPHSPLRATATRRRDWRHVGLVGVSERRVYTFVASLWSLGVAYPASLGHHWQCSYLAYQLDHLAPDGNLVAGLTRCLPGRRWPLIVTSSANVICRVLPEATTGHWLPCRCPNWPTIISVLLLGRGRSRLSPDLLAFEPVCAGSMGSSRHNAQLVNGVHHLLILRSAGNRELHHQAGELGICPGGSICSWAQFYPFLRPSSGYTEAMKVNLAARSGTGVAQPHGTLSLFQTKQSRTLKEIAGIRDVWLGSDSGICSKSVKPSGRHPYGPRMVATLCPSKRVSEKAEQLEENDKVTVRLEVH